MVAARCNYIFICLRLRVCLFLGASHYYKLLHKSFVGHTELDFTEVLEVSLWDKTIGREVFILSHKYT